jgi:hypothetical protein
VLWAKGFFAGLIFRMLWELVFQGIWADQNWFAGNRINDEKQQL